MPAPLRLGGGIQAGSNLGLRRVNLVGDIANSGAALHAVGTNVEIEDSVLTGNQSIFSDRFDS